MAFKEAVAVVLNSWRVGVLKSVATTKKALHWVPTFLNPSKVDAWGKAIIALSGLVQEIPEGDIA